MTWADLALAAIVAAAVLMAPGLALALALGVRGLVAVVVAPVLSTGVLVLGSIVLGVLRVPWSLGALAGVAVVCVLAAVPIGLLLRRRRSARPTGAPPRLGTPAIVGVATGAVIGAALIVVQLATAFGAPDAISQAFDVVFHLNGIRFVLDGGDASPFVLGTLNGGSGLQAFYPSAWHALAALLVQTTGVTIPLAANAASIAIAAVAWPLGCVLLVRVVAGPRPIALAIAGVLAAGFGQFPMLLLDWGVLYPNFFGLALVPSVLALALVALGVGVGAPVDRITALVLLLPATLGMAGAHPSGLAAVALFALPAALWAQWRWFRRRRAAGRRGAAGILPSIALLVGTVVALIVLWRVLRPTNGFPGWQPTQSPGRALLGVLFGSLTSGTPSPVVAIIILVGCVVAVATRRAWATVAYAIAMLLFVVAAAAPSAVLRSLLVDAWYQDVYRVAATAVVMAVPMAALGGDWLLDRLGRLLGRIPAVARVRVRRGTAVVAVVLCALLASAGIQGPQLARQIEKMHRNYELTAQSPLLTPDELALLRRLPGIVPAGVAVADNPWDGSALAYAISDRPVLVPHLIEVALTPDQRLVARGLRTARQDPAVCAALHRLRIGYALDFGAYLEADAGADAYPGLDRLDDSDSVALVTRIGDARLYRVLPCRS